MSMTGPAGGQDKKSRFKGLYLARKISQLLFLGIFCFLFLNTDYSGEDQLEYAVNILFRLDPYLAAATMIGCKVFIALMLPSLLVVLSALILGRSFCGWFCPLGTILDGVRRFLPTDKKGIKTLYPRLGRILLLASLVLALFGFHVAGYLDPFSLLVRGLSQALYPAFHGMTETFFSFTYSSAPAAVNSVTEPLYSLLKEYVLPVDRKYFSHVYLSFALLMGVLLLEMAQKRFFCRNLCPLGALLGWLSSRGLLRGVGGDDGCKKCRVCAGVCRMGAIGDERQIDMSDCNLCMECVVACPSKKIDFSFNPAQRIVTRKGLSRRQFISTLVAGVVLPSIKGADVLARQDDPLLIRPPGALPEEEFLLRCIRCGECHQVCIGNALQPALLEGGLDGVFSPKLVARTGYCEFNCTLCGQVCPTGAIEQLTLAEKHKRKIGHAFFDKNRCIPFAKHVSCMVCEEHCPTAKKAIRFKETMVENDDGEKVMVKLPYVVDDLCIGCGICENKCPLPGASAIIVTNANEERNPKKKLVIQPLNSPY